MALIVRGRAVAAWSAALPLLLGGCGGFPMQDAPPPIATSTEITCTMTPAAADLAGRFLATGISGPPSGTLVEALLAVGGEGPQLAGRRIAFAGRILGGVPGVAPSDGRLLVLADAAPGGDPACAGAVRLILPAEAAAGTPFKGAALASATLSGLEVAGTTVGCTALSIDSHTVGVECPVIGVRSAIEASQGSLWLRLRWAGTPAAVASVPDWATTLIAPSASPGASASPAASGSGAPAGGLMTGHVSIDTPAIDAQVDGDVPWEARVEPANGTVRYHASMGLALPVDPVTGFAPFGSLALDIPDYRGPGAYETAWARLQLDRDSPALTGCRATIAAGERSGELLCGVDATGGGQATGHLVAAWTAGEVTNNVGADVRITWRISGSYVSDGAATVHWERVSTRPPGLLWVPDVRLGGDGPEPELLRIQVSGFTGDGRYTGDAAVASLQKVRIDSPRVLHQDPAWAGTGEPWTPLFGACVATVRDGGASGQVTCTPDANARDVRGAGPATLEATWVPAS